MKLKALWKNTILCWVLCSLLLLFSVLVPQPAIASASGTPELQQEQTYTLTETQLKGLETRLTLLDQILAQQNPELTTLQLQLAESKKELAMLRNELATSKEQLTKADESLRNANLFLEKSAQEAKKERLRIKAQRNGWAAAAACLVVALVVK